MKLFLGGGGSREKSLELDKLFAKEIGIKKPLLYIPIAIDEIKHPHPECFEWISKTFNPLGINDIVMWTDLNGRTLSDLDTFSGIYIGGGNTFKLVKLMRESGFWELLKEAAERGIPIYGGSAGAVILAQTVIPALSADPNDVEIKDFTALNLVNNNEVWCHYTEAINDLIRDYIKKYNLHDVIAISEGAGIIVNGSKIRAVGPEKVYIFTPSNKHELPSEGLR